MLLLVVETARKVDITLGKTVGSLMRNSQLKLQLFLSQLKLRKTTSNFVREQLATLVYLGLKRVILSENT